MAFYSLEKTGNLTAGYRRSFRVAGRSLLLLEHEGKAYVLDNICPHAGYPMEEGKIVDGKLRCPMHGYLFDLKNGDCVFHPEGPCRGVQAYPIMIEGDELGVELEETGIRQREG